MDELVGYCAWEAQTLSVWLLNQNQDSDQLKAALVSGPWEQPKATAWHLLPATADTHVEKSSLPNE